VILSLTTTSRARFAPSVYQTGVFGTPTIRVAVFHDLRVNKFGTSRRPTPPLSSTATTVAAPALAACAKPSTYTIPVAIVPIATTGTFSNLAFSAEPTNPVPTATTIATITLPAAATLSAAAEPAPATPASPPSPPPPSPPPPPPPPLSGALRE